MQGGPVQLRRAGQRQVQSGCAGVTEPAEENPMRSNCRLTFLCSVVLSFGMASQVYAQTAAQLPDAPQPQSQKQEAQKPVGTAAAEPLVVTGVAASKPAGFALAPRKQHRVRSILIKVGVIVGAGAAVGTVIALTKASPGRPPGS